MLTVLVNDYISEIRLLCTYLFIEFNAFTTHQFLPSATKLFRRFSTSLSMPLCFDPSIFFGDCVAGASVGDSVDGSFTSNDGDDVGAVVQLLCGTSLQIAHITGQQCV